MAIYQGGYAPNLYNENKKYYLFQAQEYANLTDAELRDMHEMSNTFLRRFIDHQIGNCSINDGFKIEQATSTSNNFKIKGGDGSLDNPGVYYLKGHYLFLKGDINYTDQTSTGSITGDAYTKTPFVALTTPTFGLSANLNAIAHGDNNFFSSDSNGNIIRNIDGGRNWTPANISVESLNAVSMIDSSTGYIVGNNGVVFKTLNAGNSWSTVAGSPVPGSMNLFGGQFLDVNNGWITGASNLGVGTIRKTTNGGTSWLTPSSLDATVDLYGISMVDALNGWAVGQSGAIVNTTDGGTVWADQSSATSQDLNSVVSRNSTLAFIFGNQGTIQKTTTGGTSWSLLDSSTTKNLYSGYFLNDNTGWAAGADGLVLSTFNSGTTWDSTTLIDSTDFRGISFKDSTGFVVGENGIIFRTLDTGLTWQRYRTDTVYLDFHLGEVSGDPDMSSEYTDIGLVDATVGLPSANRLRMVADVRVSEGWPMPIDYVDGDSTHYTSAIATILRYPGQASIFQGDISDTRKKTRTLEELDALLKSGGIDSSSIAPGSIHPSHLDSSGDYTFRTLNTTGDTTIGGDLDVKGILRVEDVRTSAIMDNLLVNGSVTLGDVTTPHDDTVSINGRVIQQNDQGISYLITSDASTLNSSVFYIDSKGTGKVFEIKKESDSTEPVINLLSNGKGTDFNITHSGTKGGIFSIVDDASSDSISLIKTAPGYLGSVLNLKTNSTDPTIYINNIASSASTGLKIDQTAGTMIKLNTSSNANGLNIASSGSGTDMKIVHAGTAGMALDITSAGLGGSLNVLNTLGQAIKISQKDNATLMSLDKDGSGFGLGLEINNYGTDVALGVYNNYKGLGLLVSHVGDSTHPGLDVYVAGQEVGPALRVNKANHDSSNDVGEAAFIWNQGYSQTLRLLHDNTDSTSPAIDLLNRSHGLDFSSSRWKVDGTGNITTFGTIRGTTLYINDVSSTNWSIGASGDITSTKLVFDSTHYMRASAIVLDYNNLDASNPGVEGKIFRDSSGYMRISKGSIPW